MRATKFLALSLVACSIPTLRAEPETPAGLQNPAKTNLPPYRVRVERVGGPGLFPANFAYITLGTNRFGFVMPEGFRLESENWEKVTLVSADLSCLLCFRVLELIPTNGGEVEVARCRQLVLASRTACKILEEFSLAALCRRGPAFDLGWKADRGVPRRERVLFIPTDAGLVEFSLVSSMDGFEAGRQAFNTFIATFRAPGPDGRLVMPVLSDRL